MDLGRPEADAYGRVTKPERYQAVIDAAHVLIDDVIATYEPQTSLGASEVDFPDLRGSPSTATHLIPAEGAPLYFMFTGFPGVVMRAGRLYIESFPACGCDACDESPAELIESIARVVTDVVDGRYQEQLTKTEMMWSFSRDWGSSSTVKRLERGEWKKYGATHTSEWPAWPKRPERPSDLHRVHRPHSP